jgi:hypothetical protein
MMYTIIPFNLVPQVFCTTHCLSYRTLPDFALSPVCNRSLEKLSAAGVVRFNPDSLTVEPLPETHVMSRHMIKLGTMATLMHLTPSSSMFNVSGGEVDG